MKRQAVESSNIWSIGYDPQSKTLEIEFNGGRIYQYYGVPQSEYDELMSASSCGSYFHANIKNNYDWTRIS